MYIGSGIKSRFDPLPQKIDIIQKENVWDNLKEQKEPNPEDEALVIETDSEPENNGSVKDEENTN